MCKKENYGPVIFPYEMTSQGAAKLCNLFDSEIFLIDDQTSVQMAKSLMNQTKKGNYTVTTNYLLLFIFTICDFNFRPNLGWLV